MTKIISLYGGPSAGKSTSAALMFSLLKMTGVNSELVREYVKAWAWSQREIGPYDQLYFLGKQIHAESTLFGKVDVIVTDSPIFLGIYYARKQSPGLIASAIEITAKNFVDQAIKDGHEYYHVMLRRTKPYSSAGRYQSEDEAKNIDQRVGDILVEDLGLTVDYINTDKDSLLIWLEQHHLMGNK